MNEKAAPWVGLFVTSGIILLAIFTFMVDDEGKIRLNREEGVEYYLRFRDAGGLKKGGQIFRDGVKVGKVTRIVMVDGDRPQAVVRMNPGKYIYANDAVRLRIASLIAGGQNIHLITNPNGIGEQYAPESVIDGESPTSLASAIESVDSLVTGLDRMMKKFEHDYDTELKPSMTNIHDVTDALVTSKGTLGKLLNEDTYYTSTMKSLQNTAKRIEEGPGTLHKLVYENTLYDDTDALIDNIRKPIDKIDRTFSEAKKFMTNLNEGNGVITQLVYDKEWTKKTSKMLEDVQEAGRVLREVFDKVDTGNGAIARLINDEQIAQRITNAVDFMESMTKDMAELFKNVKEGKGTLGQLFTDTKLYEEAENLLGEIRSAVEDSREFVPVSSALGVVFGTAR